MQHPKVIFVDAVGTLFGVKGSVGEIYKSQLPKHIEVSVDRINQAFVESFNASVPPVFPGTDPQNLGERECDWWKAIVQETFKKSEVLDQLDPSQFERIFMEIYAHFTTAEPWEVYPDVKIVLKHWCNKGIDLGIISNFDTRLYGVLADLDLIQFFQSITIASQVGAAKPEKKIFEAALEKHNCKPDEAWYIGDSEEEDCEGAESAGFIKVYHLQRHPSVT